MLLRGTSPRASKWAASQSGDGPTLTPRTIRAWYTRQFSGASFSTTTPASDPLRGLAGTSWVGSLSLRSVKATTSRARPKWALQSPRLEVVSTSSRMSSPMRVVTGSVCSTGKPARVRRSAASSHSTGRSKRALIHRREASIGCRGYPGGGLGAKPLQLFCARKMLHGDGWGAFGELPVSGGFPGAGLCDHHPFGPRGPSIRV